MRWPDWISNALRTPAPKRKRRNLSTAERRKRDEQFIPLAVGRLEDRRVLSGSPLSLGGANPLTSVTNSSLSSNNGTLVSALILNKVTDASNPTGPFGVAVVGFNNTHGNWQYSTTGGSSWTSFSSVSGLGTTKAVLLDQNSRVRFQPSTGFSGTVSGGLTFVAWDTTSGTPSSGNAGELADTSNSTNGTDLSSGVTGLVFSSSSASSDITVQAPLVIGGTGNTPINDDQTATPFSSATLTDNVSSSETDTVTITFSGAAGTLSEPISITGGFTGSNGVYSMSDTATNIQADLRALVFTPSPPNIAPGMTRTTTFTLQLNNQPAGGTDSTSDNNSAVVITSTAPVLSSSTGNSLTSITVNSAGGSSTVMNLISGIATDPDNGNLNNDGIAVVGFSGNGTWKYNINGPLNFPAVSMSNALLLNVGDTVTFIPNAGFSGTATITFYLWDGFNGTGGHLKDLTTTGVGGETPFSATSATSSILVNNAPVLSGANKLPAITENLDSASNSGTPVATLISNPAQITDTAGSLTGIAVTGVDDTSGYWQYSFDGATWLYFGGASSGTAAPANAVLDLSTAAVLLQPADLVRFVPNTNFVGTSSGLSLLAWDQTSGTAGSSVDLSGVGATGGTTAFSAAASPATASIQVVAPPTLDDPANPLTGILEGTTSATDTPDTVSALIAGKTTDAAGDPLGIAVTGADDTSGFWQYSLNGSTWLYFGTNSTTAPSGNSPLDLSNNAVLLDSSDQVRFVPGSSTFTGTAALTFYAWDTSIGGVDGQAGVNVSSPNGVILSANSATSTITVIAPPTIGGSGTVVTSDSAAVDPFNAGGSPLTIADTNAPAPVYDVTLGLSTTANGNFSGASLTAGGWSGSGSSYTLTGVTAAQAQADLQGLEFDPNGTQQAFPGNTTQFTVTLAYNGHAAATDSTDFSVQIKDPPTLTGPANNFTRVFENDSNINAHNTGDSVSNLLAGNTTDSSGLDAGIAVTSVDDTNGAWEYSLNNGTTWIYIGTPPAADSTGTTQAYSNASLGPTAALLLAPTALVRFVPNAGFSGSVSDGITYQAWDQTGGTSGGTGDATQTGGASPFSTASLSSSIYVDGIPTISGTATTPITIADNASNTKPFTGVTIGQTGDPSLTAPPNVTVTVTLLDSDGTTHALNNNGTLTTSSGFTQTGSHTGVYTFTGSAADATMALDGLVFNPTAAKVTILEISVDNGHATPTVDDNTTINALAPPTVTGSATQATDDGVPITPFVKSSTPVVTISDTSESPPPLTVTITLTNGSNAAAGNLDGLSDPNAANDGFTETSTRGVYTFTDAYANINTDLQGLVFTSVVTTGHPRQVTSTQFQVSVSDGVNPTVTDGSKTTVNITELNIAPMLNGANNLPSIPTNANPDSGVPVSDLISGQVTDPETSQPVGIAVTNVDDTHGFWEYSLDGGTTWIYFINPTAGNPDNSPFKSSTHTTTHAAPSESTALLLSPTDEVRFVADPGFTGTAAIKFRAWDGSNGASAGTTANTSPNGGSTSFSTAEQQSTVTVLAAPTFSGSAAVVTSDSAAVDPFNVSGTPLTITDTNASAPVYDVTLSMSTTANGSFSAASLTAGGWTGSGSSFTLSGVTAAQAQAALQGLEFDPNGTQLSPPASTTKFTVSLAYDTPQTMDTQTVATTTAGSFAVTIKDAPTLTGSANFAPVFENDLTINGHNTGMSVAALIAGNATDHSGVATGIAVTAVDDTNGAWEYSLDSGTTWVYIGVPPVSDPTGTTQAYPNASFGPTAALLLPSTALVRFVPNSGFSGLVSGGITFQAWDGTGGTAGGTADATQNGGATAFSTASQSPTIFVDGLATINGAATTPISITDETTGTTPLSGVQIGQTSDPSNVPNVTVTVALLNSDAAGVLTPAGDANGTLSTTSGFTESSPGLYTFTGTAAAAQTALQALVFTPTAHQAVPGDSVTTVLAISVSNQHAAPATDSNTTINAAAVHDPPTMTIVNSASGHPVTYILPAASMGNAIDGTTIGTISGREVDRFDAGSPPTISFQITGPDAAAFAIASVQPAADGTYTAVLKVVDATALAYSATPIVLTVTATDSITAPLVGAAHTQDLTVNLWQVSASATPIGATSSTTVTVGLQDPSSDVFHSVVVNFDDGHTASPSSPIAPGTFSFNHFFTSNPGPTAASPIPITVTVVDSQGHTAVIQTIASVDGTGITGAIVIQQTTSAAVLLTPAIVLTPVAQQVAVDASTGQQGDTGVAPSEVTAGEGRQVLLRIVTADGTPDGKEGADIPVLGPAQNDLPGLLKKLPDGHYRVYLSEDGRTRLMLDVVVRGGRPSDPSQESSGGEDRPPSSQIEYHPPALVANKAGVGKQSLPMPGGATNSADGVKDQPKAELPVPATPQPTPAGVPSVPGPKTGDGAELQRHGRSDAEHAAWEAATAGLGLAAVGLEFRPQEIDRVMARLSKRSLSKAARLGRRLRGAAGRLPK